MIRAFNPKSIAAPIGARNYSHGVLVPPNTHLLYISGQVGVRPDGSFGATIEEQTDTVWTNILAILAEVGMSLTDIVKINCFLTRAENLPPFRSIRAKYLGEHRPASTTFMVQALGYPEILVEVEAVAAKESPTDTLPDVR